MTNRVGLAVARALLLVGLSLVGFFATAPQAHAWQLFYANYTSFGGYNHWQYAGGSGTKYGVIPMYSTVWSTGETANVGGNIWLKVNWNGHWGWSVHLLQGYDWSFSYRGVTSTPWSANTSPANGVSTNSRRPPIRWNYGDPDGDASNAANIQIATDSGFGSLVRNGGTGLGGYDPNWDMAPGQYWWRAQTHSWINGWGAWSSPTWFIVRHPTRTLISAPNPSPVVGTSTPIDVTVERYWDGAVRGAASSAAVTLQQSTDGSSWSSVSTGNTNSSGVIQFSVAPAQRTYYRATSAESQWNVASSSGQVTIVPQQRPTSLSVAVSTPGPVLGDAVTISGQLRDGAAVPGAAIQLQSSPDGSSWAGVAGLATDANGDYAFQHTPSGRTFYRVWYPGDATRTATYSSAIQVTPVLLDVTITCSFSNTSPRAGDPITASGRVTASGSAVSGVDVKVQTSADGATWRDVQGATADSAGGYSVSFTPDGPALYRVVSSQKSRYAAGATAGMRIAPVLRSASITFASSASRPLLGSAFTLSGRLTEIGAGGVSGATVRIQRSSDGSNWSDAGSASTNSNGDFSYSTSITTPQHFRVTFAATSIHAGVSSDSIFTAPSESDDDARGATWVNSWPHTGTIRDAYDERDVLRIDLDGSGHPVDLSLRAPAGSQFDLEVFPSYVASVLNAAPIQSTRASAGILGLRLPNAYPASVYVAVVRRSGSGAYTIARTNHTDPEVVLDDYSARPITCGQVVTLTGAVLPRPWLSGPVPVEVRIVHTASGSVRTVSATAEDGTFRVDVKPSENSRISVRCAAVGSEPAGAWSAEASARVKAVVSRPIIPKTARRGQRFTVRGYVTPQHRGTVRVETWRWSKGKWARYRSKTVGLSSRGLRGKSQFSLSTALSAPGYYSFVIWHADASHASSRNPAGKANPVVEIK